MSTTLEAAQLELRDTINNLGCAVVRGVSSRDGDVRVLFSVTDPNKWLKLLNLFLDDVPKSWYTFIGQKYFRSNGRLGRAWVAIFETDGDLDDMIQGVRETFLSASNKLTPQRRGIMEWEGESLTVDLPWAPIQPRGNGQSFG